MVNKNNKGFTLVELLAVIAVLGLILIIAVPKVMDVLNTQKKRTLELTTRSIIKAAEEKYLENTSYGIEEEITCESVSNINRSDFDACDISFDDNGNASVIINGKGRYDDLACQGTKEGITCQKEAIYIPLRCTYDGVLVKGAEFTKGQYTYRYKEEYVISDLSTLDAEWVEIEQDGWHVRLTNLSSTSPVNTPICAHINGKPLVSTTLMFTSQDADGNFAQSKTTSIDVGEWYTNNVTNMLGMFYGTTSAIEIKGLSKLETGNATNMAGMFAGSGATTLDLSNFDTKNVTDMSAMFNGCTATTLNLTSFDTSKVTAMFAMFVSSAATTLDLSSFDTSKVTNMSFMFNIAAATTGYARTQADADRLNSSYAIPDTLTFIVKTN